MPFQGIAILGRDHAETGRSHRTGIRNGTGNILGL